MLFKQYPIIMRGGGDLGTGVVYRLHKAGFPVIVLELANPLVVRRRVALAAAVHENEVQIEDMRGRRVGTVEEAEAVIAGGDIPVLVAPELSPVIDGLSTPHFCVIDARLAKRNIDTNCDQAPLVIALGPGFTAGIDCHAIIETKRGHTLGRVIWDGSAIPNTGSPGIIAGRGAERVLRAPANGPVRWDFEIGDIVQDNQILGSVVGEPIAAPFAGVVRGLIASGTVVHRGLKIGDVDARADREACFTISDKALSIGGGVLEALFTFLDRQAATG